MINRSILSIERNIGADGGVSFISGVASGVPLGGNPGQVLTKQSSNNYDTYWADQEVPVVASTEFLLQTAYNGSGTTINKGEAVYIAGAEGSTIVVGKAVANSAHDSEVIGIALDNILNNEYGSIVIHGIVDGLNTNSFSEGDRLYLSTTSDGQITNIEPSAPNHSILIGYCVKKDSIDGAIFINVNTGEHLNSLHNVSINSPVSRDILFFDSDEIWKNKNLGDILSGYATSGDLSMLYPRDNPSGYITGIDTSNFYTNDNPSGYATTGQLSNYYLASNPSGYITGIQNLVYTTGDQQISGAKGFLQRPTVNGTGVLLEGEVQNNTIISGVVYSAQVNVKNGEGNTIYKGQPVYIKSADGNNIIVGLASNSGEQTSSKTLGLLVQDSLAQNAFGTVITDGLLEGFNASAANAGDPIWLGPTGSLIYGLANKPYAPNHLVYLGVVTRAQNNGELFVKVQNGYELEELHNVNVTGAVSGQFLFKNNALWNAKQISISDISNLQSSLDSKQMTGDYYASNNPSGFITGIKDLVYTTGNQNVSGIKNFEEGLQVASGLSGLSTLYVLSGAVGINNENPRASLDVSGSTIFSRRPTVNGTGLLLNGDIDISSFYPASNPSGFITGNLSNYVTNSQTGAFYPSSNPSGFIGSVNLVDFISITGAQTISGSKTFISPPLETKATPVITAGTLALDLSSASLFYVNLNSATNITLNNVPTSPKVHSFTLQFVADGTARSVTWPSGSRWAAGTTPTLTSISGKVDTFTFLTHDGGVNWFAYTSSQNQ